MIPDGSFRVRSLTTTLYLPNFLFAVGKGVAVPIIALLALELGASPALAGIVVALRGAGTMAFDIPAGILVSRFGERRAMAVAGLVLSAISIGIWMRPPLWLYAALITLMGCTWSVWHIARIAYATGSSAVQHRGRVMSVLGGFTRIGLLVGPLLGSLFIARGGLTEPFLVLAVLAAASSASMAVARRVPFTAEPVSRGRRPGIGRVLAENRRSLATAGSVAIAVQVLRSSREVLIPLWGDHIGIDVSTIPLIFSVSYAFETLMFYPIGLLMDRKGRKWAAVPFIGLLSLGIAAIPSTSGIASLTAVAVLIGLANGLGSGINMTLGSDLAPLVGRSRFLGIWRLVTDVGDLGGPLLVAASTSAISLAAGAFVVGGVGIAGLLVLWRLVPETLVASDT